MFFVFIVKVGSKYLSIDGDRGEYVLKDTIKGANIFDSEEDAMYHIEGTIEAGKYLKQKKKVLKYQVTLVEETHYIS